MSVAEIELKSWTAARIGELTQTRESDCLEIAECILGFDDPAVLKDWLKDFTEKSAEHKACGAPSAPRGSRDPTGTMVSILREQTDPENQVGSFVEALFERKERLQEGAAPAPPAAAPADRSKGKGQPKRELPTMDMPYLPRQEGDKRLMVVDASSGRHKVLTNCLNCGKARERQKRTLQVIVEQEGWGPCLFCGNPLEVGDQRNGVKRGDERGRIESHGTSVEEEEKFNASFQRAVATKDARYGHACAARCTGKRAANRLHAAGLRAADRHQDRLLTYDRDAKRRTKVYDDATDWFTESQNPWLSEKQREDARAKGQDEERRRREERRKIHAKIDLFGRTVIDTGAEVEEHRSARGREANVKVIRSARNHRNGEPKPSPLVFSDFAAGIPQPPVKNTFVHYNVHCASVQVEQGELRRHQTAPAKTAAPAARVARVADDDESDEETDVPVEVLRPVDELKPMTLVTDS
eukprot:g12385.t1